MVPTNEDDSPGKLSTDSLGILFLPQGEISEMKYPFVVVYAASPGSYDRGIMLTDVSGPRGTPGAILENARMSEMRVADDPGRRGH